jgi:hypothetical protein
MRNNDELSTSMYMSLLDGKPAKNLPATLTIAPPETLLYMANPAAKQEHSAYFTIQHEP